METNAPYRSLRQGEMLNWYRVERILGRGGFGVIYLATDTNLDVLVAIKEYRALLPDRDSDTDTFTQGVSRSASEGVQSFIREARNLVRFKHPNIVRVMSVFELNDTAYMVMEFEEGNDLREHLQRPENATEEALKELIRPISKGLAEIHRHGFVHRDIKPANILVRNDGSPVLLDFGSARSSAQTGSEDHTALVSAGYSPLEQYSGDSDQQQGPWTDIYALGAVLYFAVTGCEPVDSVKRGSALLNGGKDPMLPARLLGQGRYSDDFLRAIDWALAFRIADRPQTLSDWIPALFRNSINSRVTRKVTPDESGVAGKLAGADDSLGGISMLEESVPREVEAVRDRRIQARQPGVRGPQGRNTEELPPTQRLVTRRHKRGRSLTDKRKRTLYWAIPLALASAVAMSWLVLVATDLAPEGQGGTTNTAGTIVPKTGGQSGAAQQSDETRSGGRGTDAQAASGPNETATLAAGKDGTGKPDKVSEQAAEAARQAEEAARLQEQADAAIAEEKARQLAEAEAAAEKARLEALETDRKARLRARRQQLAQALSTAARHLDEGSLDEAEAALDEAASLNRNDAELKSLRSRWRTALVDARTPVSDNDFDRVIERFDRLRRAIEDNDVEAMESLTEPSGQNALFRQLMSQFSKLDISIDQIRVTNADKSINARLRIVRMIRENGDRATPSPAYRDRTISSRRIEGKWSLISW